VCYCVLKVFFLRILQSLKRTKVNTVWEGPGGKSLCRVYSLRSGKVWEFEKRQEMGIHWLFHTWGGGLFDALRQKHFVHDLLLNDL